MLHQTITHADPVDAAVEKANGWAVIATPIIKAYLAIDLIDGDMGSAWLTANGNRKWSTPASYAENAIDDARRHIKEAREELYASIEGIREDFICDEWFREPDAPKDTSDGSPMTSIPALAEPPKRFPIMARNDQNEPVRHYIAWEVAELFRKPAMRNHGQSLERLAQRGGLSWFEAACALANSDLYKGIKPDQRTAQIMLAGAAHALDRLKDQSHLRSAKG